MREGRTFKRCSKCGKKVEERACVCGNRTYSWAYVVDVAPEGAPRRQKRGGGFATKGEAIKAMAEVQRSHEEGTAVEKSKLTVGAYLASWLTKIEPPRSRQGRKPMTSGTWHEWRNRVENYIIPRIGGVRLQTLTADDLEDMYEDLEVAGRVRGSGGLARSTVHSIHTTLHAALADAVARNLVPKNVADGQGRPPGRTTVKPLAVEELRAFVESVKDDEHYALWRLAAMTGARRSELLALRWSDIDLASGTITIDKARVKSGSGVVEGPPKSERSRRTIGIDAGTVEALAEHRRAQPVANLHGYAFTYANGKPLDPDGVSQRFRHRAELAGIVWEVADESGDVRHVVPSMKVLRHTSVTFRLNVLREPLHIVSAYHGHADESFTARVYAQFMPSDRGEVATRFAAAVDGT